jgi:hypothetical protein
MKLDRPPYESYQANLFLSDQRPLARPHWMKQQGSWVSRGPNYDKACEMLQIKYKVEDDTLC